MNLRDLRIVDESYPKESYKDILNEFENMEFNNIIKDDLKTHFSEDEVESYSKIDKFLRLDKSGKTFVCKSQLCTAEHLLTKLITINGNTFSCDRYMISLVKKLNELGIKTIACCDGHLGYSPAFVSIVGDYDFIDTVNTDAVLINKMVYKENIKVLNIEKDVPRWSFSAVELMSIYKYFNRVLGICISPFDLN